MGRYEGTMLALWKRVAAIRILGFRAAVICRPARLPITAGLPTDATTTSLLDKSFGAKLGSGLSMLGRQAGRALGRSVHLVVVARPAGKLDGRCATAGST